MEENTNNLATRIAEKIKNGQIKCKSKYLCLVERIGLAGLLVSGILISVLALDLTLYYLKTSDTRHYLKFGYQGLWAFLDHFPYLLVAIFVIVLLLMGYVVHKWHIAYKKPFYIIASVSGLFIILTSSMLVFTGLNECWEKRIFYSHPEIGRELGPNFMFNKMKQERGLTGRVLTVNNQIVLVQTPNFEEVVIVNEKKRTTGLEPGIMAIFIGQRQRDQFFAIDFQIINDDDIPMIKRNIQHRKNNTNIPLLTNIEVK